MDSRLLDRIGQSKGDCGLFASVSLMTYTSMQGRSKTCLELY